MPHLFEPLTIRGLTVKNRIMMSPMCQYSAGPDGIANDWHYVHYTTRAVGGVALIMVEATAVESRGRISEDDLGIWDDSQVPDLKRLVGKCHDLGAKVGLQLAHAGAKAFSGAKAFGPEQPVGPMAVPFDADWNVPHGLTLWEIETIVVAFQRGAARAKEAGFDCLELHAGHGYLLSEFLSPLTNGREDEYGGSVEGRVRLLHRVVDAVRAVIPAEMPLFARVSASDWVPGGMDIGQMVEVAKTLPAHGVDVVDCSSGAVSPKAVVPVAPGYQLPFAHRIKRETGLAAVGVGLISAPELADEVIRNRRADLVALGRALLRQPYWTLDAARVLGVDVEWPVQYQRAKR